MLHILIINDHSPQTFSNIIINYKQWTLKINLCTNHRSQYSKEHSNTTYTKNQQDHLQSCAKIISSINLKIKFLLKISPNSVSKRASQILLILKNNFHNHEPGSHSFTISWFSKLNNHQKNTTFQHIKRIFKKIERARESINIAIPFYDFKKSTPSQMLKINNIHIISLITNQQLNPKSDLYSESQLLSIKRSIQILDVLMMKHPTSQSFTKITLNQHSMILKIDFECKITTSQVI